MTSKEKAKKLYEIADALKEWGKYNEKVTNSSERGTPEAKQIIRKALTLLVDNLVLLNECKNKYGCHSPLQKCFVAIEQAASRPKTEDLGDYRAWTRDFTERHLWGGVKRSLADECLRYAEEFARELNEEDKRLNKDREYGGDDFRDDDWRKDFIRFLTEEKKWLEIDFVNEKYKTMSIDLSIRHPESKKLIAVVDFKESIDRNIEIKAKASFAQFAELELGKYLVTPSSEKSNYSFTIYKYSDRGLVRMQPNDFPAYEEREPMIPDKKLTLSDFESKLDVDAIKIFNKVIDSAESSSIGLDIQITDESYINLRSTWAERKIDNVVMQIHRYGEPDTRIALAVAGIKTGATVSTKPKLNDHITKGVISLLSGYEKGIAGEIAWLNGNLPVKGTREKASVYVIEREIVNNPEAWDGVDELLDWAVENIDKSPPDEQMEASIAGNSLSDQPAKVDKLGFEPYTSAIAKFLSDKDTIPPLTMSIEGEWGSGKSSFMIQLQDKLKKNGGLIVTFSPWRHDKEDSVWGAFVLTFVEQLSKSLLWWDSFKANIELLMRRFDWRSCWPSLIKFFSQIIVFVIIIIVVTLILWKGNIPFIDSNAMKFILSMAGIFGVAWSVIKKAQDYVGNPLKHDLKKYIQTPDYAGRICFVEKFHNDFEKVVETYARGKNIYVFIDDLDRCNVPKAAELMQSINLMISDDPKIIFIIGMDREKVAAGIAVKHRELIQYLYPETETQKENWQGSSQWHNGLRYGYSYVEKFIQVPFDIPRPKVDQIENMLSDNKLYIPSKPKIKDGPTTTTKTVDNNETYLKETKEIKSRQPLKLEKDSEEVKKIIRMVSPSLDCNPRKAKQFVNLFRLKAYIIYETDLSFMSGIDSKGLTLEQLGKIVAISLNWPLLLGDIAKDKTLFVELIKYAETKDRKEDSLSREITRHWGKDEQLMELISFNSMRGDSMPHQWTTYTLTNVNIVKLLEVSPKVRDIGATSEL